MNKELVQINKAKTALIEARDLYEILDIRDKAMAMSAYADAQGASEASNIAKEIQLRAERKAGEFLRDMPKQKPGEYQRSHDVTVAPSLDDIGISKMQSHRWQLSSELPDEDFEQIIAKTLASDGELTSGAIQVAAKKRRQSQERKKRHDDLVESVTNIPYSNRYKLLHGDVVDMMRTIDSASIDVIVSDPPYPKEYIPLYGAMAAEAKRVLKPGGLCVLMVGQSYLPDLFDLILEHLTYHWTAFYHAPGASTQLFQRKILSQGKPLLLFVNGEYTGNWLYDVCKSDRPDKEHHEWGQSESGMLDIVEKYTMPNDLVLDPFCGAGTTGVVALRLGRRFVGIDNDIDSINLAKGRFESDTKET